MRLLVILGLPGLVASALLGAADAGSQTSMTIFARPTTVAWTEGSNLFGTAPGARAGDLVSIQVRKCGSPVFQQYAEAHANGGGGWSMPVGTAVTSEFRAVWRGKRTSPVTIRQGARVALGRKRLGNGFTVTVFSTRSLWRRQVEIQRRSGSSWTTMKRVRLSDSVRSTGTVSVSRAAFLLATRSGTRLRAVLPADEAKPCYVRSISRVVRV